MNTKQIALILVFMVGLFFINQSVLGSTSKGLTVTFVPDNILDAGNRKDNPETKSYIHYGNQSDHIVSIGSADEFFDKLLKYKKHGFQIKEMYIVGHGSGDKDNPSINMGTEFLLPDNFDLELVKDKLQNYKKLLTDPDQQDEGDKYDNKQTIKKLEKKIALLESLSSVMVPNANVHVVSCSAVRNEKGKKFVKNLGQVLMGKKGGKIHASSKDIAVDQITGYVWQSLVAFWKGSFIPIGDYYSLGSWESYPISSNTKTMGEETKTKIPLGLNQEETQKISFGSKYSNKTVKVSFIAKTFGTWDTGGKNEDFLIVIANGQTILKSHKKGSSSYEIDTKLDGGGNLAIQFLADVTGDDEGVEISNIKISK